MQSLVTAILVYTDTYFCGGVDVRVASMTAIVHVGLSYLSTVDLRLVEDGRANVLSRVLLNNLGEVG